MVKKDEEKDDWGTPGDGNTGEQGSTEEVTNTEAREKAKINAEAKAKADAILAEAKKKAKAKAKAKAKPKSEVIPPATPETPVKRTRRTFPSSNGMRSEKSIIAAVKTLQGRYDYLIRTGKYTEMDIVKVKEQINALLWATHSNFTNEEWLRL